MYSVGGHQTQLKIMYQCACCESQAKWRKEQNKTQQNSRVHYEKILSQMYLGILHGVRKDPATSKVFKIFFFFLLAAQTQTQEVHGTCLMCLLLAL